MFEAHKSFGRHLLYDAKNLASEVRQLEVCSLPAANCVASYKSHTPRIAASDNETISYVLSFILSAL